MQRAGRVVRKLPLGGEAPPAEDVVRAAWPQAVGPNIARNSRFVGLRGARAIVEVPDALFQHNLRGFEAEILKRLVDVAGPGLVTSLTIRIGVPRIQPKRAGDEADGIRDPGLRRIYRASKGRLTS